MTAADVAFPASPIEWAAMQASIFALRESLTLLYLFKMEREGGVCVWLMIIDMFSGLVLAIVDHAIVAIFESTCFECSCVVVDSYIKINGTASELVLPPTIRVVTRQLSLSNVMANNDVSISIPAPRPTANTQNRRIIRS